MSTGILGYSENVASYAALVERLPEDSTLVLHGVPWEDYE